MLLSNGIAALFISRDEHKANFNHHSSYCMDLFDAMQPYTKSVTLLHAGSSADPQTHFSVLSALGDLAFPFENNL